MVRPGAWLAAAALGASACGGGDEQVQAAGLPSPGQPPEAAPPAHVVGGFSVEIPEATLAPGEETTPCWLLPLEIVGPSRVVGGGRLDVGGGMHHGNVTTRKKSGEGIRPCPDDVNAGVGGEAGDILDGGAVLFGSSTQISGTEWQSFPDGVGYRLREGYEMVARMHYLNASPEPIVIAPRYEWFTIDEAKVVHEVGPFAWTYKGFEIPPKGELTVHGDCAFPVDMSLVNVLPHMHKLGRGFSASYLGGAKDGEPFLQSKGYDPEAGVMRQYDPPIDLSQGDGASFSCTWHNTFDKPIVEGIGDNEMCILFGYAWPAANAWSAVAAADGNCLVLAPPPP